MKTALECIPCFVRQAAEAVEMCATDAARSERILRRLLREIADADWAAMPVAIAQRVQRIVREETGQADPYRALKDRMNRIALGLLPSLTDLARRHRNPREAVTRLAIAGDLLDAGSKSRLAPEGQGNYETLSDTAKDVFFLLAVKCPLIAAKIGAPVGALVVRRGKKGERG